MKWLALLLLVVLQSSCTTLVNRRDLYSPEPGPDSREVMRQLATTTSVTTRTVHSAREDVAPLPY